METSVQKEISLYSNVRNVLGKCRKLKKKVKSVMMKVLRKKARRYILPQSHHSNDDTGMESSESNIPHGTRGNFRLNNAAIEYQEHSTTKGSFGPFCEQNDLPQTNALTQSQITSTLCEKRVDILQPDSEITENLVTSAVFKQLDDVDLTVSRLGDSSLKTISERLTRGCHTELSKARVLFRWVVERDLRRGRHNPRQCYHRIFNALCRFAGLRCEIIEGYSKGTGYLPGMRFEGNKFRNTWTAVSIKNQWRFVNCTWAARRKTNYHVDSVDEFYFLTDPKDYIYQHFPDNPRWQLLQTPITMTDFQRLPVLKPSFFKQRLALNPLQGAVMCSTEKNVKLKIEVPHDVEIACCLIRKDNPDKTFDNSVTLFWEEKKAVIIMETPSSEDRYLNVYAGKSGSQLEIACNFILTPRTGIQEPTL